jgi:hypothetical protein
MVGGPLDPQSDEARISLFHSTFRCTPTSKNRIVASRAHSPGSHLVVDNVVTTSALLQSVFRIRTPNLLIRRHGRKT